MARQSSGNKNYREILLDIKKGEFAPVYLLMGEEPYYLDCIMESLEKSVVSEADRDFNLDVYYGQDIDIATVIAAAQQFPVMAPRRLVALKEAQSMEQAKARLEQLTEYVKRPTPTTVFVVVYKGGNIDGRGKLMSAAAKSDAVVYKSAKLREYEMAAPIKEYCLARKIGIEDKAVTMLIESLGMDLAKVFGEIDKLIIAEGKATRITADAVQRNIGISKEFNNFELHSALASKDYDKALRIIAYFKSNPTKNPTVVTTGTLFGFYSKLVIAHFLGDKSDASVMQELKLTNKFALGEYRTAMTRYTPRQALGAVHALRDFDVRSKGIDSFQNEYDLLSELIYRIFTIR